MLFEAINFVACVVFAGTIIHGAKEYEIKKDFMFWARLVSFGFLSAGLMNLAVTKPTFYVFAGAAISLIASYILSTSKNASTLELLGNLVSAMFFWPYFVSYLFFSVAYYDRILAKINKKDDGYG
jgi:hypothetical protein